MSGREVRGIAYVADRAHPAYCRPCEASTAETIARGQGKDMDQRSWGSVIRQLTAMGLIVVDNAFGALHLSEEARPVFKGERKVTLRRDRPRKATETRRALQNATPPGIGPSHQDTPSSPGTAPESENNPAGPLGPRIRDMPRPSRPADVGNGAGN